MKELSIIVALFIFFNGFGQKPKTISEKEFEKMRLEIVELSKKDPDSAKNLANKLVEIAEKSNNQQLIANSLTSKVRSDVFIKDAIKLNQKALHINRKLKNENEIASNLSLFGVIYLYKADYNNAVKYFNESLDISIKNKLYNLTKKNYRSLSTLYGLQEDYPKSLKMAQEALKLEEIEPNDFDKAFAYICFADYYDYTENTDEAKKHYQLAYDLFKKGKSEYNMAITLLNWSILYEESNPVKSLEMELQAQKIFDKIVPKSLYAANNLGNMGDGFFSIAKNDSLLKTIKSNAISNSKKELLALSEDCFVRSFKILKNNKNAYGLFYMSGSLSELQAYKGDYKNAYANLLESKKLGDSLFSQKNKNAIAKLESEKEVLELKTKNEKKATLNKILIASSLALLFISFLGYRNFRNKQKVQNLKITELEKDKQLLAIDAMLKGQEEERGRIAKDLHDGLGGLLSGTKLSFTNMKENLILTPENATQFDKSLKMLDTTIADLRKVAHNLMPEALVKFGLNDALRDFCNSIQSSSSIIVEYQKMGINRKIDNTSETFIYRIIQELVNNAVKHSNAQEIMVQLTIENNKVFITVEDNGKGYDATIAKNLKGDGLNNIDYRVQYLNGKIDTLTSPNNGTSVNIELNA